MSTLERAIAIAALAHAGRLDKAGQPYVLHPLRVMQSLDGAEERIVAVLHDVVEDHAEAWSFERLEKEGFSANVIEALRAVTKRPDEEDPADATPEEKWMRYARFVRRAAAHPVARAVKIADLQDNMDLSRLPHVSDKDLRRNEKYRKALELLRQPST